jgi:hypothetical protein
MGSGIVSCGSGVPGSSSPACCVVESLTTSVPASEWEFARDNLAKLKVNELLGPGALVISEKLAGISGK